MAIDNTAGNQSQVRELLDNLAQAVRSKNVDGVMSHYSPDMLLFDLAPPLQYQGAEACRKNWATWFSTFRARAGTPRLATVISAS